MADCGSSPKGSQDSSVGTSEDKTWQRNTQSGRQRNRIQGGPHYRQPDSFKGRQGSGRHDNKYEFRSRDDKCNTQNPRQNQLEDYWGHPKGQQNRPTRGGQRGRGRHDDRGRSSHNRQAGEGGSHEAPDGETFTFFWQRDSPFSQHHPCFFTVEDVRYNSAEQYMMHQKAVLFGDHATAKEILKADSPHKQKKLGRQVADFDERTWKNYRREIVMKGNLAKFAQNQELKVQLMATAKTTLVEASPFDKIWGIGMAADDPRAQNRKTWQGGNLLGQILTDVRNKLDRDEKFSFFFGCDSPFSQHHSCSFEIDGVKYSSAEQYMMYQKAVCFGDQKMAKAIIDTDDPKEQKKLGRQVSNFDPKTWDSKSQTVVKEGNLAKFSQNEELKRALLATGSTILVEASPRDQLWGIGLGAKNPKAWDQATWRGKNKLGFILTDVRDILKKQDANIEDTKQKGAKKKDSKDKKNVDAKPEVETETLMEQDGKSEKTEQEQVTLTEQDANEGTTQEVGKETSMEQDAKNEDAKQEGENEVLMEQDGKNEDKKQEVAKDTLKTE